MDLKIFALFDKKALAYATPFFFHNKAEALRALDDITNNAQSSVNRHPDDYQIFELGSYNDQTGSIVSLPKPVFLEEAKAFQKKDLKNGI